MAKKFGPTIKKLQTAINEKFDVHLIINKNQFYSVEADRILEIYIIKQAILDDNHKVKYVELFSSASDVQITLWLRDYWYELNNWEVPSDNEEWNKAKEQYEGKRYGKR